MVILTHKDKIEEVSSDFHDIHIIKYNVQIDDEHCVLVSYRQFVGMLV